MRNLKFKHYIALLVTLLACQISSAQYIGEFGVLGGVSYYHGDANSVKPFVENHPAVGALLRIKMNDRFMVKFDFAHAAVSGDTRNFPENKLPGNVDAKFERSFFELGAQVELNFFKYGLSSWDKEVYYHTAYVLLGPSLAMYQDWNGNEFSPSLTFGVGYKYKLTKRLNIGVEWSMRKLFRDDFDVTDVYNEILENPYGTGQSSFKNNDWYSFAFAFLTFDIFRERGKCMENR